MTLAKAITKHVRITPRKARYAIDLIRGKNVIEAGMLLASCNMKGGKLIKKTLDSAIANAENNAEAKREELFVSHAVVDEGTHLKRAWARSKGRRAMILRRTSHFTIHLSKQVKKEKGK